MKTVLRFFAGLLLLATMLCALCLSGMIFTVSRNTVIEPYFFQPHESYLNRPGVPARSHDFGDESMRRRLVSKYITEYFYVTPDIATLEKRMKAETSLALMSTAEVFDNWLNTVAPTIKTLAESGVLRTVKLVDMTLESEFAAGMRSGQYWRVTYELKTWRRPNDFSVVPEITQGVLYLDLVFQNRLRDMVNNMTVSQYLESGRDPVAAFRFGVIDATTENVL